MNKFEIEASSYKEAVKKAADQGFEVVRNITSSYKKLKDATKFDQFCEEMVKGFKIGAEQALVIVVEPGSADTRERPYTMDYKISKGALSKTLVYEVRKASDNSLVASAAEKIDAIRKAKEAMKELREDLYCERVYRIDDAHKTAFNLKYTPSAGAKIGKYIVVTR